MPERKRLLLVDDSATTLMMERMLLKSEPYSLFTAKNGVEALDVAADKLPDLILLDVVMPVMDGFETCRQLRAKHGSRDTPIIMVTTRGEEVHVEKGFASGCTDYITKPIDGLELLAKVRSYLGTGS